MTPRPAIDQDGPALGKLYADCGMPHPEVDWHQEGIGAGWWVVETEDDTLVGAIRVLPTRPWGHIAEVLVHPDARQPDALGHAADLTELLFATAFAVLAREGVLEARGVVDEANVGWRRIVSRYGGMDLGPCRRFGRRIDG